MRTNFDRIKQSLMSALKLDRRFDDLKMNQGLMLSRQHQAISSRNLSDYEFRVFSQWGEDGILQFLTQSLNVRNKTFIEFGVEDFFESNCRFLLMKDLWKGFVIDGSESNIERLRNSYFYWRYQLRSKAAFITRESIVSLLDESGFDKDLGILSIDLDGIDYYVLEELEHWRPAILIVEYNAVFGRSHAVTVPYDPNFRRTEKHYSNLYFGASLTAFCNLALRRGYALVGVNSMGSNAFFVRRELLNDSVREVEPGAAFRDSTFRESRDAEGRMTMLEGDLRLKVMAELPVVELISGATIRVGDLV